MSNEKPTQFDRNGFAHAMTNEYLRAVIAATYADVDPNERVMVNLPVKCSDPMLYRGLFAKFGGGCSDIEMGEGEGGLYKVQGEGLTLSGSTEYSLCLVVGLTIADFLPV